MRQHPAGHLPHYVTHGEILAHRAQFGQDTYITMWDFSPDAYLDRYGYHRIQRTENMLLQDNPYEQRILLFDPGEKKQVFFIKSQTAMVPQNVWHAVLNASEDTYGTCDCIDSQLNPYPVICKHRLFVRSLYEQGRIDFYRPQYIHGLNTNSFLL